MRHPHRLTAMLRISRSVTGLAALFAVPAWAQDAPASYESPGKDFSFQLPAGWRATADGERLQITSADGTRYVLVKDAPGLASKGDPAVSPELRAAAEKVAKPLLQ